MPELDLLYKPDAAQSAARVEAYWHKAIIDRAPILLTAPKPNPQPLPKKEHATLRGGGWMSKCGDHWCNHRRQHLLGR